MSLISDKELMNGIRMGDSSSYEYLYKRYVPRLRSFAYAFVSDNDVVNDIIQDCFVNIWMRRHSLTTVSLSGLLFTMVRNKCLNYLKKQNRIRFDSLEHITGGWERLHTIDMYGNADMPLMVDELRNAIIKALDGLSERTAQIFKMSRFEGLSTREIATQLNISMTAVENHINKALSRLSDQFSYTK